MTADPNAPLVPVADLALLLGLTTPLTPQLEAQLAMAAAGTSRMIRDYCGRVLNLDDYSETYFPNAHRPAAPYWAGWQGPPPRIRLVELPISELSEVRIGETVIDPAGYGFDARTGDVWLYDVAWLGGFYGEVAVDYVGGYDPIPSDLQMVAAGMTRRVLAGLGVEMATGGEAGAPGPVRAVTVGALRVEYATAPSAIGEVAKTLATPLSGTLEHFAPVLDLYRSVRRYAAAGWP